MAKTVGPDLVRKVLTISLEQTTKFVGAYMEAVTEFKDRHFEDRSVRKLFTHYVIAVANNCLQFQQLFDKSYTDCCTGQAALSKGDNETSQVRLFWNPSRVSDIPSKLIPFFIFFRATR